MGEGTRNLVLGGIAVVLLLVAGYFTFKTGSDSGGVPTEYVTFGVCLACQRESEARLPLTEPPPAECPYCDKRAHYPWFICLNCGGRFVPKLERPEIDGPLRIPLYKRCPLCGHGHARQYDPQLDDAQRSGKDAPLPPWEE